MSQCSTTMLGSCGLMAGAIIVPPPPGPTMVQGSKRGAGPGLVAARAIAGSIHARTVVRFIGVPYLSAECLTVLAARRTRQHIPRGKPRVCGASSWMGRFVLWFMFVDLAGRRRFPLDQRHQESHQQGNTGITDHGRSLQRLEP